MADTKDIRVEEIIERLDADFGARIYYLALRELRSAAAAEDARNETLVRVIAALRQGGVREMAALPGFVAGVTRNVIREQYRKKQPTEDVTEIEIAAEEREITVDHTERRAMELTWKRLNEREKKIIHFAFFEDLTRDEIALRMGIPAARVRLVKSRALQTFREIYSRVTEGNRK